MISFLKIKRIFINKAKQNRRVMAKFAQFVNVDNKPHINGSSRRWPQPYHTYGITCPRGRGLKQNYDNIWKYLLSKNLITIKWDDNDMRSKIVKLK